MADLSFTLTAGNDEFTNSESTIYDVVVKADSGKTISIADGSTAVIRLVATEDTATITRYKKLTATDTAISIDSSTGYRLGSFYSAATTVTATSGTIYGTYTIA